jgi:hypothetical protein
LSEHVVKLLAQRYFASEAVLRKAQARGGAKFPILREKTADFSSAFQVLQ